jgi:hypothetical protein
MWVCKRPNSRDRCVSTVRTRPSPVAPIAARESRDDTLAAGQTIVRVARGHAPSGHLAPGCPLCSVPVAGFVFFVTRDPGGSGSRSGRTASAALGWCATATAFRTQSRRTLTSSLLDSVCKVPGLARTRARRGVPRTNRT